MEIEKNRSIKTRENYEHYLKSFLDFGKIKNEKEITSEVVREFRLYLARRGIKKNTQSYYIIALRNFLKYLIKRDIEVLSPDKIELPKIPTRQIEIIEYGDLERLLNAPNGSDLRSLRDKAILETLFSTGLRISELCGLNRYFDIDRGEISVRGKGGKLRIVFLSERAKKAIKNYLNKRTDAEEALFISLTKSSKLKAKSSPKVVGRIIPRAIQRIVDFYGRKAGIPEKVHPHTLRHLFRHRSSGRRRRPPLSSGAFRPCQCFHHSNLHSFNQQGVKGDSQNFSWPSAKVGTPPRLQRYA